MSCVEQLEEYNLILDRQYLITKFLYLFALDTAPIKLSEYPVEGPTIGGPETEGFQQKVKADEKFNVLETKRF